MSHNEEFDELARRKLEERRFPFREADWQDARDRIDAQRAGRGRGAAWISALVLLIAGGLAWHGWRTTLPPVPVHPIAQAATEPRQAEVHEAGNDGSSSARVTTGAEGAQQQVAEGRSMATPRPAATERQNEQNATGTGAEALPAPLRKEQGAHAATGASTAFHAPRTEAIPSGLTTKTNKTLAERHAPFATEEPGSTATSAPVNSAAGQQQADAMRLLDHAGPTARLAAEQGTDQRPTGLAQSVPDAVAPGAPPLEIKRDEPSARAPETGVVIAEARPSGDAPVPEGSGNADVSFPVSDSNGATAPALTAPQDSAPAPVVPAAPPLIPERAPWEVGILGGVFSSTTRYAGGNSAEWAGNLSGERSMGIGAELMHVGRNIGIGTGLYYGSYAERIRTDAIDASNTTFHQYWYLMPVDTTVLVITDTLPGQPPVYTGTSVNTTVNVLAQGTDTITSNRHLRDARNQVNRVSYLEVPLLLDAHLVQGRWSIGVRGGPTIGLLTGRRGNLPNSTDDGYLGFNDVAFREVTFGYTARAYVRYRFNAGWSVGVEPALRGQLLNSFGSGELERRSAAKGVVLSLTYRLR